MKVLLYGIARQELTLPSGRVLDLRGDGEWRRMIDSLRAHVPLTRPPLYREHDEDGPALGYVEQALPVSREQLVRAGVPVDTLPHQEYVMFRARLNRRGQVQLNIGDIARTSIGLAFDVVDDQGREWPYFLDELSAVDKPHVRTQPTADELSLVSLRAGRGGAVRLSGRLLTRSKSMDAAKVKDYLLGLAGALGIDLNEEAHEETASDSHDDAEQVLDELARDEEHMADHDEEEDMAYDDKEDMSAVASLTERVKSLEGQLEKERMKARAAELNARIDRSGAKLSAKDRKALLRIGLADKEGFETSLRLASGGAKSTRIAASGAPEEPPETMQDAVNRRLRNRKEG